MEITGTLNPAVESHLKAYCEKKGYSTDQKDMVDLVLEEHTVWRETGDSHRWYDEEYCVVKIDGKLIGYAWYHMTGDASPNDMGLDVDLSSIEFAEEYQVTETKYRPLATA